MPWNREVRSGELEEGKVSKRLEKHPVCSRTQIHKHKLKSRRGGNHSPVHTHRKTVSLSLALGSLPATSSSPSVVATMPQLSPPLPLSTLLRGHFAPAGTLQLMINVTFLAGTSRSISSLSVSV